MAKTSVTHPLQIDEVGLRNGRLGLTFCPGKQQPGALSGAWARDLPTDLRAVADWGARQVITLLEDHELSELGVGDLGAQAEALGLEWHLVRIPDGGVPDRPARAAWFLASARAHRFLEAGGRVVLHCKGGLGRTGMMAARLLAEAGVSPREAMRAVRQARPGAIENLAQEHEVLGTAPLPAGWVEKADKVLGVLLGGAVGDGLGYAVEFLKLDAILERWGESGLQEPVYQDGALIVSDDTQMTLFTAEALLRTHARFCSRGLAGFGDVVWYAYRRWLGTQLGPLAEPASEPGWLAGLPVLQHRRAPGGTCVTALQSSETPVARAANHSKGCGGVMRVAPIGLCGEAKQAYRDASRAAATTHGHPSGYIASGAMAAIVSLASREGLALADAARRVVPLCEAEKGAGETIAALTGALERAASQEDARAAVRALGEGWVAEEALAVGLFAALRGRSFPEVLRIAANHDGDSDSTASIAGQLYGAAFGLADLPLPWVRRLDVLEPLLILAHDLTALVCDADARLQSYPPN